MKTFILTPLKQAATWLQGLLKDRSPFGLRPGRGPRRLKIVTGTCRSAHSVDSGFGSLARVHVRTSPHPLEPDYSPPSAPAGYRKPSGR